MLPLSTLSSPSIRHLQTALLPLYSCLTLPYPITLNHIPESYAFPPSTTSLNPILFHPQPHPWILAFSILNSTFKPFSLFYLTTFNPNPLFLFPPPHPKPPSALNPRPVCFPRQSPNIPLPTPTLPPVPHLLQLFHLKLLRRLLLVILPYLLTLFHSSTLNSEPISILTPSSFYP